MRRRSRLSWFTSAARWTAGGRQCVSTRPRPCRSWSNSRRVGALGAWSARRGAEAGSERGAEDAGVDEPTRLVEQLMLVSALRFGERSGEHELPMPGDALGLEGEQVEALGI